VRFAHVYRRFVFLHNLIAYNPVDRAKLKKPKKEDVFKGDFYTIDEANLLHFYTINGIFLL